MGQTRTEKVYSRRYGPHVVLIFLSIQRAVLVESGANVKIGVKLEPWSRAEYPADPPMHVVVILLSRSMQIAGGFRYGLILGGRRLFCCHCLVACHHLRASSLPRRVLPCPSFRALFFQLPRAVGLQPSFSSPLPLSSVLPFPRSLRSRRFCSPFDPPLCLLRSCSRSSFRYLRSSPCGSAPFVCAHDFLLSFCRFQIRSHLRGLVCFVLALLWVGTGEV